MSEVIDRFEVFAARVPMRIPFVHATRDRTVAESVLVKVSADPDVGWGEGAPREYVTGESMESVIELLSSVRLGELNSQIEWSSFESAVVSVSRLAIPNATGAARSAVEIAVLDLVCRMNNKSLRDAFDVVCSTPAFLSEPEDTSISLVLQLANDPVEVIRTLPSATLDSLSHVKVKGSREIDATIRRVRDVQVCLNPKTEVSIDANGVWSREDVLSRAEDLSALGLSWLEEPTAARDWTTMLQLCSAGINVMLDESFVSARDIEQAAEKRAATHLNLRVSKCGGVLATLKVAELAQTLGFGLQVGVQVGELGPLWAAGRAIGTSLRNMETMEAGRQDEWFPEPLTVPPYEVDRAAYRVKPVVGVGTGVLPSEALIAQLESVSKQGVGS